jgi:F-type H+-transporting ATPase subunit b
MDFIWDFVDPGLFVSHLVNFAILFFLFKKFLGDHLVNMIQERRALLDKVSNADVEYDRRIAEAEAEKKSLIDEGVDHKNKLIEEAKLSAQQKADSIVADAEKNADGIAKKAHEKAAKLETDLKNNFVDGVKQTAHVVVKKLFNKDVGLEEKYLDELVSEFAK